MSRNRQLYILRLEHLSHVRGNDSSRIPRRSDRTSFIPRACGNDSRFRPCWSNGLNLIQHTLEWFMPSFRKTRRPHVRSTRVGVSRIDVLIQSNPCDLSHMRGSESSARINALRIISFVPRVWEWFIKYVLWTSWKIVCPTCVEWFVVISRFGYRWYSLSHASGNEPYAIAPPSLINVFILRKLEWVRVEWWRS